MPYAPGIPSKSNLGDVNQLDTAKLYDLIIQRHKAHRAGDHYDIRIGDKNLGLFSWATKKELPEPGKPIALFQQPVHSYNYKDFEGTLPFGYGAGTVKKHHEGKVLITHKDEEGIHFTMADKRDPQRFVLVRPPTAYQKQWLLAKAKPLPKHETEKIKFKLIDGEKAKEIISKMKPGTFVQPKIDGALNLVKLLKDRVEVMSYRHSKQTGHPIVHTERFFGSVPRVNIPKGLVGSVLFAEVYGKKGNKVIPPQELGGILNSALAKSLQTQKERGIDLKASVFDIAQIGNKQIKHDMPYAEKKKLLNQIIPYLPQNKFHPVEEKVSRPSALKLFQDIQAGRHPMTREGVVIRNGGRFKYKTTAEHDVYIRRFFAGENKYEGNAVGGFYYSYTPTGEVAGKVGTGISDDLRRDMFANPSKYIGRIARVEAQEKYPSGALRMPVLIAIHEDY
jgi:hypothetical protein